MRVYALPADRTHKLKLRSFRRIARAVLFTLHYSRRREAQRIVRQSRHLLFGDAADRPEQG
jgi:hypothetical protein